MVTGSLFVNDDIILANKRQNNWERQKAIPMAAVQALAQQQKRPRYFLDMTHYEGRVALIGQLTRTPTYDPVTQALQYVSEGADAVTFFTDHAVYDNDFDDMLMVARGIKHKAVLYQNYILDEYSLISARAADASAVMIYADLFQQPQVRNLVTLAQRWKMTAFLHSRHVDKLIEYAHPLSPHMICLGMSASIHGDFEAFVGQLRYLRHNLPFHTCLMPAPTLSHLDQIQACVQSGVDAVVIGQELLRNANKMARVRQILQERVSLK